MAAHSSTVGLESYLAFGNSPEQAGLRALRFQTVDSPPLAALDDRHILSSDSATTTLIAQNDSHRALDTSLRALSSRPNRTRTSTELDERDRITKQTERTHTHRGDTRHPH